jgi:ABC-type glycerol-3-phosphate transport system substrate-binding protein
MNTLSRFTIFAVFVVTLSFTLLSVAAQEPITLDVWTFSDADPIMPSIIEAFQTAYPHITVQWTDVPEGEYATKLDTAFLAGAPPDVVSPNSRQIATGLFMSLDDTIAAQNINLDDFNTAALTATSIVWEAILGQSSCSTTRTCSMLPGYRIPRPPNPYPLTSMPRLCGN